MPTYTSLLQSNNAQFHGGLAWAKAWLSEELKNQGAKVDVPELRLEPLKGDYLDLVVEYLKQAAGEQAAGEQAAGEQAAGDSYFLRIPVEKAMVDSHSRFLDECIRLLLDEINTNVRVLFPLSQTLRGMKGVSGTSISYDCKKVTLCIWRNRRRRCIFNWDLAQLRSEYLLSGTQSALVKQAIKKAGISPSDKDCKPMPLKSPPRAPIRKRRYA